MPVTRRDYDAAALMQIACGFDSLSGDVMGTAVTGMPGNPAGGTEIVFSLYKVESIEDFLKTLEVSASASIQAGFGKGGATAKYASKLKIHQYSIYIAATVTVNTGTRILQTPKLDDAAAQMLTTPEGQVKFRKMYGDEFLAGITSGGEFVALLEIQTKSQDEQEAASASINGSDSIGANQGTASFQSFIQSIKSKYEITVHSLQRGGSDPNAAVTPETLIDKATSFPSTVTGVNVFDYVASFQTYDVLPRPEGANPIDILNQRDVMDALGLYRGRYQQVIDSIEYILANSSQFEAFDSMVLVAKRNELLGVINKLMKAASDCFKDYKQCALPVDLGDPVFQPPKRLAKSSLEAVAAAKQAVVEAQGHVVACKGHAARVQEISQSVQAGPDGIALVNEAKKELANAEAEAKMVHVAADAAIAAGNGFAIASEYVDAAKVAAKQADEAVAMAKSLQQQISDIAFAPQKLLIWLFNNSVATVYVLIPSQDNLQTWITPGQSTHINNDTITYPYDAEFEIRLKPQGGDYKSF